MSSTEPQTITDNTTSSFSAWQQNLVDNPQSDTPSVKLVTTQQAFVKKAATSAEALAEYLHEKLNIGNALYLTEAVPPLEKISADEMLRTPFEWEHHVGTQLTDMNEIDASSAVWWYACHIVWLQNGVFPDPPHETFKARVNNTTLNAPPESLTTRNTKDLDKATRNLLRRLGGLPHVRHAKTVALDPPIARAYWRYKLAEVAASAEPAADLTTETCHRIFRGGWGLFIDKSQLTFTSVLEPRALAAVCFLAHKNHSKGININDVQHVARNSLYAHPGLADWSALTNSTTPKPNA